MQSESLTYQEQSVLQLLRDHLQSQRDAIRSLETKANYNFTIVNIVAGIVAYGVWDTRRWCWQKFGEAGGAP